jgi:hypothetical protein
VVERGGAQGAPCVGWAGGVPAARLSEASAKGGESGEVPRRGGPAAQKVGTYPTSFLALGRVVL